MNVVVLWHGSPIENKESILKYGISYRKPDVKRMIEEAISKIEKTLGVKISKVDSIIKDRILESTRKGGIVYVSGNKEYAKSNALAGREWFYMILQRAIYQKYKDKYDVVHKIGRRILQLQRKLDEYPKIERKLLEEGKYEEYDRVSREEEKVLKQYHKLSQVSSRKNKELSELEDKIERMFHSKRAVVFKIVIPWKVLKELSADDYTKNILKLVEEGRISLEEINELHLKEVPRQYIVSWEEFEK